MTAAVPFDSTFPPIASRLGIVRGTGGAWPPPIDKDPP
jgi:hypothetical protein